VASHRKPRTTNLRSTTAKRGAVGVTTAALASVSLLSQNAQAAPDDGKPSVTEVRKQVDKLYQQAESSTQKYNAAKERTDAQRAKADRSLDEAAKRTEKLNDARRMLGSIATAQYRSGGMSPTASLLLMDDPQQFFRQSHVLDRMTGRQKQAVTDFERQRKAAERKREAAAGELASLASSQKELKKNKQAVQAKLAKARSMLSKLTAEEKARLAAIEKRKEAAARKAAEQGAGQASSNTSAAGKVMSFAKAQLGKPYVWGATGPSSFDCSGLTLKAWRAAGVTLPRTTFDQVNVGAKVSKSQMRPGDLIFFFDDVSHVGIYAGNGQMIHAPKPGAEVRYESIDNMPFHSANRPG
jgi:peptidoglycan DL-endopeptidase CwlO